MLLTFGVALVGLVIFVLGAPSSADESPVAGTFGAVIFFLSPAISGLWIWRPFHRKRQEAAKRAQQADLARRRFRENERLIDAVDRHKATLNRKLHMAVKKNDYGVVISDDTISVFEDFFQSIELDLDVIGFDQASSLVLDQLDSIQRGDRSVGFNADAIPIDGHAFEAWVADALMAFGWSAEVTPGSGDQGIDVVASKEGKRVGLQCKLYSTAIGNKAVQEALAGKAYYGLDAVGVLSNASFTMSAQQLAAAAGVLLLSHHDIPDLFEKLLAAHPDRRL